MISHESRVCNEAALYFVSRPKWSFWSMFILFPPLLSTASKHLFMAHPEWIARRRSNTYSKKIFKQCIWVCSFFNSNFFSSWLSNCIQSIVHRQPPLQETGTFLIIVLDLFFKPLPPSPPSMAIMRVEFPGWVGGMYCFEMVCMSVLAA